MVARLGRPDALMTTVINADYLELVAELRQSLAEGDAAAVREQLPALAEMASDVRERGQLSMLEITAGAALGDWELHQRGRDRLLGEGPDDRRAALMNLNELALLGPLPERLACVGDAVQGPGRALIEAVRHGDALRVLEQVRHYPEDAGDLGFSRDLKRWARWALLDGHLAEPTGPCLQALTDSRSSPSPDPRAPGAWEDDCILAISFLARGRWARSSCARIC